MSETTADRVQKALDKSPLSDNDIGGMLGISPSTVWRWRTGRTKRFSKGDLKTLASILRIEYEWLQFGKGSMSDDPGIKEIENRVDEAGESYKGLDQTLSDVESKANSLIRDLQSLVYEIRSLKER